MPDEGSTAGSQDARFSVDEEASDGRPVVRLRGEVDVYTSPDLQTALAELLPPGESKTVVIDLSGLDFIDSTGLGVLVGALKRARAADGDVILRSPPASIMKVFEITGLVTLFTIEA